MQSGSPDPYNSSDIQSEASSTINPVIEDEGSVENSSPECSMSSYRPERRKQRRNPSVLVQWIEEHPFNPYPTKQEKQQLAAMSGMTLRQLNDWFANARRNIKKLGFELWRKKRNGVPNHKVLSSASTTCSGGSIPSVPPNVVASDSNHRISLQPPPYMGCTSIPMYGSATGIGGVGGGTIKSIPSQHPPTAYARFNTSTSTTGLFPGSTGWYTANGYSRQDSTVTSQQCCSCSICTPSFINGISTVFSSPSSSQQQPLHTIPLTAIPWTNSTPSSTSSNYHNSYMTEQKDDGWSSSHGSPDSCPDDLTLSISLESLPPVVGFMPKEEMSMASSSSVLSNSTDIS